MAARHTFLDSLFGAGIEEAEASRHQKFMEGDTFCMFAN